MTGYEMYDYLRRFSGSDVYIDALYSKVEMMNLEHRNFFAQEIMPKYLDANGNIDLKQSKALEKLAILTLKGLDARGVAGMSFQEIIQAESSFSLPKLNFQPYLNNIIDNAQKPYEGKQQEFSEIENASKLFNEQEAIDSINNLIATYVTGASNSFFCQSSNVTSVDTLPMQGWKFHISADSLEDYQRLCDVAIPEFQKLGVQFKVVKPEKFNEQLNSDQIGKAITIYPNPSFSFKNFSPKLQAILSEDSLQPKGDMKIKGRIFARFGRFRSSPVQEKCVAGPSGDIEYDPKKNRQPAPYFLGTPSVDSILNFYDNCIKKCAKTGDFKTFTQEYYTMAECDGKSHSYMCVDIPANQKAYANLALNDAKNNTYGLSFVCQQPNGEIKVMIHKSDIPQAFYGLANAGVDAQRPDWDVRYTYHEIAPGEKQKALLLAKQLNEKYNMRAVSVVEIKPNRFALKCDTVFNKDALDLCVERNIPIKDYEPKENGNISRFIEKMTGKSMGFTERDITDGVKSLENNTMDVQQNNIDDMQER